MDPKMNYVDIISLVAVGIALAWDLWLVKKGGEPETISYRIALWSRHWPILPLLAGILLGHLFWPNRAYCGDKTTGQFCEWKYRDFRPDAPGMKAIITKAGFLTPEEMATEFFPQDNFIRMIGYECWPASKIPERFTP